MGKTRTQIQLEVAQYERLRRHAYERGASLSQTVRDLLDLAFQHMSCPGPRKGKKAMRFVGVGRDREGRRDVARNHDRYLYGR